jgi:EAL domain-containing protein (putative c-di-GMP-specific phosphodiesterase class I)
MTRCVVLNGGVSVDAEVWRFCLGLEARGVRFALDDAGRLLATPADLLRREDVAAIQSVRNEIARLVRYCDRLEVM